MTTTTRPPHTHRLTSALDGEWQRLRRAPSAIATVRSWAVRPPRPLEPHTAAVFARCADLDDVNIASQRTASDNGDSVLLALVAAARHDRLAGRILVQRLLPGLVSASAKYRFLCEGADPAEHAVGGLWIAIRRYDHARRTRHVAASLISDTVFATFRRQTRLRSATEESVEPATFDDDASDPTTAPIAELAAVIRDAAQAGVPATDLELLRHLVRAGSPGVVARERSVTARTVRNHRNRAVARVRDALAA